MRKNVLIAIAAVAVVLVYTTNAYAGCCDNGTCPMHGFFNSLGGFVYNAMPWNWGNWWGK